MAREFLLVTQDEFDAKIAENLKSREMELLSYDFEKSNHEAAIASLQHLSWTDVGPDAERKYKGLGRDQMIAKAASDGLDSATIKKVADLNALEWHRLNLEAVSVETSKSERHYDNLKVALPAGARRDAAFVKFREKEAAEQALRLEGVRARG